MTVEERLDQKGAASHVAPALAKCNRHSPAPARACDAGVKGHSAEMKGTTTSMEPNLSTIRARRAQLAKYRQQIDAEEKELEIAERALSRLAVGTDNPVAPADLISESSQRNEPSTEPIRIGAGDQPKPATHKDLVLAALRARPEPWFASSRQLQTEIAEVHGLHIEDNSFLLLLSGLMEQGIIKRSEKGIALAERDH